MLQGDVHRLYLKLRRHWPKPNGKLGELDHVREIADYYSKVDPVERQFLLAWAKKEESGIGLIPAALSGVPLIGLLFAPFLQGTVKQMAPWVWVVLWITGALTMITGVYVHHRQKAYTTLHIQILEQLAKNTAEPGKEQRSLPGPTSHVSEDDALPSHPYVHHHADGDQVGH